MFLLKISAKSNSALSILALCKVNIVQPRMLESGWNLDSAVPKNFKRKLRLTMILILRKFSMNAYKNIQNSAILKVINQDVKKFPPQDLQEVNSFFAS